MERDREAVRLVANLLDEQQGRRVRRQRDWIDVLARVNQLFLLRDAERHEVREAQLFERRVRRAQLAFPTVDDDEIRKGTALFEQLSVTTLDDLVHRREVVLRGASDAEFSILAFAHASVFAHDHRRHGFAALNRRDVEALDSPRQRGQLQHRLQRLERVVLRGGRRVESRLIRERRIPRREVDQPSLLAALRDANVDFAAGAF